MGGRICYDKRNTIAGGGERNLYNHMIYDKEEVG